MPAAAPQFPLCAGCKADRVATVTYDIIDKIVGLQNADGEYHNFRCLRHTYLAYGPCYEKIAPGINDEARLVQETKPQPYSALSALALAANRLFLTLLLVLIAAAVGAVSKCCC